jgi:RNA 2',3'-cyclic 3'-phosphodiesterase
MSSAQIRSFVSIDLDDPQIRAGIESVTATLLNLGADLKPVENENIHITIKFLGSVDRIRVEKIKTALDNIHFQPFSLEVKGAGAFPNLNRISVVWIGLGKGWTNVEQIYEQSEQILSKEGFPREARGFSPHVTIARVRSSRRRDEIARLLQDLAGKDFGSFGVKTVRLKQSVLYPSGPKYTTLYEIPAQQ